MHAKYHNSYYWENLIHTRKLNETFNQQQITDQSLFFHGIIYNSYGRRKLLEDVIHFSSVEALTGYLHYVYFPTVLLSFTNDPKGIIVPLGLSLDEMVEFVSMNEFVRYGQYIKPMQDLVELSRQSLKLRERDELVQPLRRMEAIFHTYFQKDRDAHAMLYVYGSPQDVGNYFSAIYQIDGNKQLGSELFYHRTGMRKAEWQYLCEHAADNIFNSHKFMNSVSNLLHS